MNIVHALAGFFLILAWLIPNHYLPWTAFYNEFVAFVAFFLLFLAEFKSEKRVSALALFFLLALLTVLLQLALGMYNFHIDAVMAIFYLIGAFVAYQIGLSTPKRAETVMGLAVVIFIGSLISVFIALCQWLDVVSSWIVTSERAIGNLAQPNNLATLLFWGLCSVIYLFSRRKFSAFTFIFTATFIVGGITLCNSRTSVLQFAFLTVCILWGARIKVIQRPRLVMIPIVIFFVLCFAFPGIEAVLNSSEPRSVRVVSGNYSGRLQIWRVALEAISNSSWLGYGWGQVSVAQFATLTPDTGSVVFVEHNHNILLDLLIWNGPIIGLVLIGFLMFWICRQFLATRCVASWYLLVCVGVLAIHSCLEYPLEYAYFLLPCALIIGLVDNSQGRGQPLSIPKLVYNLLVVVPSIIFLVLVWREYRLLEEDHRLMRAQNFGLPTDRTLVLSEKVVLLDGKREFIRFARTKASADMRPDELSWMKKVTYRYPIAVVIYRYSTALALNGHLQEAEIELKKIETFYGHEQYIYFKRYWQLSLNQGSEI